MPHDDIFDFRPRAGHVRDRGGRGSDSQSFVAQVMRAAIKANGGPLKLAEMRGEQQRGSARKRSSNQRSTSFNVVPSEHGIATGGPTDPRALGFLKAAYGVNETLDLLSIGRTSLYAAVKRGELTPVKFRKKTLFYAVDVAAFLTKLKEAAKQSI